MPLITIGVKSFPLQRSLFRIIAFLLLRQVSRQDNVESDATYAETRQGRQMQSQILQLPLIYPTISALQIIYHS